MYIYKYIIKKTKQKIIELASGESVSNGASLSTSVNNNNNNQKCVQTQKCYESARFFVMPDCVSKIGVCKVDRGHLPGPLINRSP